LAVYQRVPEFKVGGAVLIAEVVVAPEDTVGVGLNDMFGSRSLLVGSDAELELILYNALYLLNYVGFEIVSQTVTLNRVHERGQVYLFGRRNVAYLVAVFNLTKRDVFVIDHDLNAI
jgi:hypothetical protein